MADKKWIAKAVAKHPGVFRAKAEKAGQSTRRYAAEHKSDSGKPGAQARLALTLMSMHSQRAERRYAKR